MSERTYRADFGLYPQEKDVVETVVTLRFDPRRVDCAHCPLLETYSRKLCRMTGEYIVNDSAIGIFCPLKFDIENLNKIGKGKEYSL